jgi:RNA polymerase sigma-70 factor (ECF subfamily)
VYTTSISLLERLGRADNEQAWSDFVELYTPLLYHCARRLGLQDADAADLVQDVFALLVPKLPQWEYDPTRSFRAWLKTVLINYWRDRRPRTLVPLPADVRIPDPADVLLEAEYRRYLVARALGLMQSDFEPTTWRACWEYVAKDRPAAEVAAELEMSVAAVYIARSRVLRRLRQELQGLLE